MEAAQRGDVVSRPCVREVWNELRYILSIKAEALRKGTADDSDQFAIPSTKTPRKNIQRPSFPSSFRSLPLPTLTRRLPRHYILLFKKENGEKVFADIPEYCSLEYSHIGEYSALPGDRERRLGALAMCWLWAKVVLASPGRYVAVSTIECYIQELRHVVASTVVSDSFPLLVADARWPSDDSDVLLPAGNRLARVFRTTQRYPSLWLLQNHNHFVAGVTVNKDEE
jgi:hypothetical protein